MKKFLKENEWWFYFFLTFLLSWPVWITGNLLLPMDMRMITLIVGGFGPLAAAIILIVLKEGKSGLKGWLRKTFNFRVKVIWYLLGGIILPFTIAVVHHLIYLISGGKSGIDFSPQWLLYFAYLIPTTLLTGGNEEPGWRGYITPVLLNRFHPLITFIIVGTGWAVWHSPLYFSGNWGDSNQPFIWLLIYAMPLSVILTWLYYKSRESIIPVMLLHAGTNVVFRFFPMETKVFELFSDEFTVIKTVVYFFFAILILLISKGKFHKERRTIMPNEIYKIKNRLPGLSYAYTLNSIELPVLDITHPGFISSCDEIRLVKLLPYVEQNAEKNTEKFNRIPKFIKNYFAKHSFAMAELLQNENESSFASGISTLMMKLGPNLIGKGRRRFWDRQVTKGFGALVLRMRVRDISLCQAEGLIPLLGKHKEKNLCFINIAGGAASDNINALILVQKENPELLRNRKIEINDLDIDSFGPAFAERCLEAMKSPGNKFSDLDISFRHIHYDWNDPGELSEILSERKEWLQVCSSEGGLFEYCSDEVISQNLTVLFENSSDDIIIAGTLLHDFETVDVGIKAALKISANIKPRFLGINGLTGIIGRTKWKINGIKEGNPRYLVFSLKKDV